MKTQLIPVLMTALLAGAAVHARDNDDSDAEHPRAERHQSAPAQSQAQSQAQRQPQSQPRQQSQASQQQAQPQAQSQAQSRTQSRERQHDRSGQQPTAPVQGNSGQGNHWIPGDPNHPSAPRGNPYASGQSAVQPTPAPRAGGNGNQGSGQAAAARARAQGGSPQRQWRDSQGHDWRADRGWYDRYRGDHFRYAGGRYYARQRYSVGFYAYPRGYSTRLWLAGEWLPSAFFIDGRYDLGSYWFYGLYEPPLGCVWTRVGNDALLIDEGTGEVLDVVYDLFL